MVDMKLAGALNDRASFRRFYGFSSSELTPERMAFVRFHKALIEQGLDKVLFAAGGRSSHRLPARNRTTCKPPPKQPSD